MDNIKYLFLINILPPPRMIKRIDLISKHFDSYVVCWDKGGENNYEYDRQTPINKLNIPADRKNPLKRLWPSIKFSKTAYRELIKYKPDIIHVQSYDTLVIAKKYKIKVDSNVKLIYEVPDIHRFLTKDKKKMHIELLSKYMINEEKDGLKYVDLLILTSEAYWEHFEGNIDKEKMFYMPNIPDLHVFENIESLKAKRQDKTFKLGYIGGLRYFDELELLVDSVKENDIQLLFAGYEDGNRIKSKVKDLENVEYIGKFYYDKEVAELYSNIDAVFSVYNADMKNVRIALPNKLYEAIKTKIPIIVAKKTYLCEIVEDLGVGICVDHKSKQEMSEAILELKNNRELYNTIVENCEKAKYILTPDVNNEKLINKIKGLLTNEK